jgi:hypothetical protein
MPLHPTQNRRPVGLPARLTFFAAHNLGDNPKAGHGGPPARRFAPLSKSHSNAGSGEIRTPGLPFAASLVLQDRLAAA